MFLSTAENKFYLIMSSYVEEHVKKNSSLNFMSLVGFQASKTCIFLENFEIFEIIFRQK